METHRIVMTEPGPPEVLRSERVELSPPGPGEVLLPHTAPLSEARRAHADLQGRRTIGASILVP